MNLEQKQYKQRFISAFKKELVKMDLMDIDSVAKLNLNDSKIAELMLDNNNIPLKVLAYIYCMKDIPYNIFGYIHYDDDGFLV